LLNVQAPITAPLCVDLDGTLLNSDLLIESGLAFVHTTPLQLLKPLVWLARGGKAELKAGIASRVDIDVIHLPFNPEVLEFIKAERAKGRQIVLVTASHARYAQQVADHFQLFDRVPETATRVAQRGHEQARLAPALGARHSRGRAFTVVHLHLLAGLEGQTVKLLRLLVTQLGRKALDRVVRSLKAVQVHQVLVNRHGVAAQAQLRIDEGAIRLAFGRARQCSNARLSRWPGGGICSGQSVATPGEFDCATSHLRW